MKKINFFLFTIVFICKSCTGKEENINIALNFTHNWNGIAITDQDFNQLKFTNANGEKISIERFRYLISNINLVGSKNYHLVDVVRL